MGILSNLEVLGRQNYCEAAEMRCTRRDGYKARLWFVSQRFGERLLCNLVGGGSVCN